MSGYARSVGDVEPGDPAIQMFASGRKVRRNLIALELMLVRSTIDEAGSISSFALLNSSSLRSCGLSRHVGIVFLQEHGLNELSEAHLELADCSM